MLSIASQKISAYNVELERKCSLRNAGLIGYFLQIRHNHKDKHTRWLKVSHITNKTM